MTEENFTFPPPEYNENDGGDYFPGSPETAWKQKLIEIKHKLQGILDFETEKRLIAFFDPYLTSAGLTNITMGQVGEFLKGYDANVTAFKVYYPEYVNEDVIWIIRWMREELKIQLNKAIEGWQGDHAFVMQQRIGYDVRQRQETHDFSDRLRRRFSLKKNREEE